MASVQVTLPVALHARPAAQVVAAAGKYQAQIKIGHGGRLVDAKSLLGLLSLGAPAGTTVTVQAEGPDADAAVKGVAGVLATLRE
jgi:phosphocarrier protein HPr